MKIIEVNRRTPSLINHLLAMWEASVRATHLFLSDQEIENIKKYVPDALKNISLLITAKNKNRQSVAFMGIEQQKLEMLFFFFLERGKGLGKKLICYGMEKYAVNELTVNEQNPLAKGFYEHMGFHVYKRSELDKQGNPYTLLYMRLK